MLSNKIDINTPDLLKSEVRSDMLSFLKRLPDDSVSVFASGIDSAIINPDKYPQYWNLTKKEIKRVLDPKRSFIAYHSHFYHMGLKEKYFENSDIIPFSRYKK